MLLRTLKLHRLSCQRTGKKEKESVRDGSTSRRIDGGKAMAPTKRSVTARLIGR